MRAVQRRIPTMVQGRGKLNSLVLWNAYVSLPGKFGLNLIAHLLNRELAGGRKVSYHVSVFC